MKKTLLALSLLGVVSLFQACSDSGKSKTSCNVDEYEKGCSDGSYLTCEYDDDSDYGLGYVVEHATFVVKGVEYRCNGDKPERVSGNVNVRPRPGTNDPEPGTDPEPQDKISCKDGIIVGTSSIAQVIDNVLYRCDGDAYDSYECNDNFEEGCYGNVYVNCNDGTFSQHKTTKIGDFSYFCRKDKLVLSDLKCENNIFTDQNQHFLAIDDKLYVCNGNQVENVTSQYNSACEGTKRFYYDSEAGIYKVNDCASSAHICEEYQKGSLTYAVCVNKNDVVEGCGTANIYGNCSGNVLIICSNDDPSKGKTLRINCREQSVSQSCILVEEDYGYDCATECANGRNQYNDFGTCDGKILKYCTQSGQYAEAECDQCGFNGSYYDCI